MRLAATALAMIAIAVTGQYLMQVATGRAQLEDAELGPVGDQAQELDDGPALDHGDGMAPNDISSDDAAPDLHGDDASPDLGPDVLAEEEPELTPAPLPARQPVRAQPWTHTSAKITAYSPPRSCGDSGRGTASGTPTRWTVVATDPRVIPTWSLIEIEGFPGEVFRAEDTGGGVRGWHVDIWFPTCTQALNYGTQYRAIRVIRWGR